MLGELQTTPTLRLRVKEALWEQLPLLTLSQLIVRVPKICQWVMWISWCRSMSRTTTEKWRCNRQEDSLRSQTLTHSKRRSLRIMYHTRLRCRTSYLSMSSKTTIQSSKKGQMASSRLKVSRMSRTGYPIGSIRMALSIRLKGLWTRSCSIQTR